MGSCAGVSYCVCVKTGWAGPCRSSREGSDVQKENLGTWTGPTRAEITEKSEVRTEKGITENQGSFSGHSTPRRRQCQGLGRVCVGARVEHVRDWNVLRAVEAEQMLVSECAALCLC